MESFDGFGSSYLPFLGLGIGPHWLEWAETAEGLP